MACLCSNEGIPKKDSVLSPQKLTKTKGQNKNTTATMAKKNKSSRDRLFGNINNDKTRYSPLTQFDEDADHNMNNNNNGTYHHANNNNNDPDHIQIQIDRQDAALAQQDQALDQLSDSLMRIKSIAASIGDELDTQKPILEGMEYDVERTQTNLNRMTRRLDKLLNSGGNGGKICIIIVLVIVLAFLLFGVVNL